jgi:hypothetical protein
MASFPNAAHDDEVDSTTQALNYMVGAGGNFGLFNYVRDVALEQKALASTPPKVTRLVMPPGIGSVRIAGEEFLPDAERVVAVPIAYARALIDAGYKLAVALPETVG